MRITLAKQEVRVVVCGRKDNPDPTEMLFRAKVETDSPQPLGTYNVMGMNIIINGYIQAPWKPLPPLLGILPGFFRLCLHRSFRPYYPVLEDPKLPVNSQNKNHQGNVF